MSELITEPDLMAAFKEPSPDPARVLTWPPTLPIEVALKTAPIKRICQSYGLDRDDWEELRHNPQFVEEVEQARAELAKEGMSFKMKARLQSEELLQTAWRMIHDQKGVVPPNVRADLIKFIIRAAGLDGSKDQAANANATAALNIQINL